MSKLLRADFTRLWKSRIFWIGIVFMTAIGIISSTTQYREMKTISGWQPHIDNILFNGCVFMLIFSAVFTGLFIGTEYSDGTIRNKLIVGHTRGTVYLSNFIVCVTALFIIHFMYVAAVAAVGFPLVGNVEKSPWELVRLGLISMVTLTALTAVFLLMSMLIHSKASCCVAAMVLAMAFLMSATFIGSRLSEPEYVDSDLYGFYGMDEAGNVYRMDESGNLYDETTAKKEKNPYYPTGLKREIYEFLYDFLPGCQMLQISNQNTANPDRMVLYSLAITVAVTGGGVIFFRRKNIK